MKVSPLFRLHEFDEQVSAVREGMARVVPVPLLSLFTGYELETMVSESALWAGAILHRLGGAALTAFMSSGVWKSRHPAPPAEVGGNVQGGGADFGPHPVVLGGDGVLLQHGEVAFPEVRLGSHSASSHHR